MLHWFSPCIWGEDGGYSGIKSFWHTNPVGRIVARAFWSILAGDVIKLMGFDKHPELKKLKPRSDAMLTGTSFSILNYDTDFFEFIRNGTVNVHIKDISHLSPGRVHLDDTEQTALNSDSMLCVTGWKRLPPIKFLPEGIEMRIGLPHNLEQGIKTQSLATDSKLLAEVDAHIERRFPGLTATPKFNPNYKPLTQTQAFSVPDGDMDASSAPDTSDMLYRFMVPANAEFLRTKDLAFAGSVANFSNVLCAYVQGLWISAYFDGKLVRDPSSSVRAYYDAETSKFEADNGMTLARVQYETVLHNRFGKWRYPNDPGAKHPDFVFEAVPYLDMMMADLGLKVHRKSGWFKEISEPYGPEDYKDIIDEWIGKHGSV